MHNFSGKNRTLGEQRKLHPAGPSHVGIYKTHLHSNLKYLPTTSVHHMCYATHPSVSGFSLSFDFI